MISFSSWPNLLQFPDYDSLNIPTAPGYSEHAFHATWRWNNLWNYVKDECCRLPVLKAKVLVWM